MKKFRLKKEAVPFILERHATSIYPLDTWESLGIDIKALEEVKPMYLKYGIKTSENSTTLGGWNLEKGTSFEFTIYFPDVTWHDHDKFSKGRMTRELMDLIQQRINDFYERFAAGEFKELTS